MAGESPAPSIVVRCKEDLAKRLGLQSSNITVVDVQPVVWPDASLGMPDGDSVHAQVQKPGHLIILTGKNSRHAYTASANVMKYGGAEMLWSYSLLYTGPDATDPDLNGILYQCSLLGTNRLAVASGVSGFYPQKDGMVIVKRRTSRSSHELLLVKVDGLKKCIPMTAAFDFVGAALNDDGKQWAEIVKSAVGQAWNLTINGIFEKSSMARTVDLPEGVHPQKICWEKSGIFLLGEKDGRKLVFQIDPTDANATWKPIRFTAFPGLSDYVLNKSQTLVVEEVEKDGVKGCEVARLWFNDNRDTCGFVPGFKLRDHDFLAGRFVVMSGENATGNVACVVDIGTEETHPCFGGIGTDVKAFDFPPHFSPLKPGPVQFEK